MRTTRVLCLFLALALFQVAVGFAGTTAQPATPTQEQLLKDIFSSPSRMAAPPQGPMFYGYCTITCDPCWGPGACPKVGTKNQICAYACN